MASPTLHYETAEHALCDASTLAAIVVEMEFYLGRAQALPLPSSPLPLADLPDMHASNRAAEGTMT